MFTLNLIEIRHFVDPFIREPSLELDPNVLSRLLNRLCNMGLELTSSNMTTKGRKYIAEGFRYEFRVIPVTVFPKCDDIIHGMIWTLLEIFSNHFWCIRRFLQ